MKIHLDMDRNTTIPVSTLDTLSNRIQRKKFQLINLDKLNYTLKAIKPVTLRQQVDLEDLQALRDYMKHHNTLNPIRIVTVEDDMIQDNLYYLYHILSNSDHQANSYKLDFKYGIWEALYLIVKDPILLDKKRREQFLASRIGGGESITLYNKLLADTVSGIVSPDHCRWLFNNLIGYSKELDKYMQKIIGYAMSSNTEYSVKNYFNMSTEFILSKERITVLNIFRYNLLSILSSVYACVLNHIYLNNKASLNIRTAKNLSIIYESNEDIDLDIAVNIEGVILKPEIVKRKIEGVELHAI